jgi:hypothetical protein
LLVAHVFVSRQHEIEPCRLSGRYQFAVSKPVPSTFDGILNYCRTKLSMGVVEAIKGNINTLLRRSRGYKNLRYLLLKAQRMAATRTEFIAIKKTA